MLLGWSKSCYSPSTKLLKSHALPFARLVEKTRRGPRPPRSAAGTALAQPVPTGAGQRQAVCAEAGARDLGPGVTYFLVRAVPLRMHPCLLGGGRGVRGLCGSGALCNQGVSGKDALVRSGQIRKLLLSPWRMVVRI